MRHYCSIIAAYIECKAWIDNTDDGTAAKLAAIEGYVEESQKTGGVQKYVPLLIKLMQALFSSGAMQP